MEKSSKEQELQETYNDKLDKAKIEAYTYIWDDEGITIDGRLSLEELKRIVEIYTEYKNLYEKEIKRDI